MSYISSFHNFFQATSFNYRAVSVYSWVILQGAAKEDLVESFLGLFFSGELVYPLEDQKEGISGMFSYIWHQAKHLPSLTAQFPSRSALFSEATTGKVH